MKNLLQLEFRRLFRAKAFYICILISLAMILISAATTKLLLKTMENADDIASAMGAAALQAPTGLTMMKQIGSSSVTLLLAIFVCLFVTEDFVGDTIKNVYSRGYTRTGVYLSKYLVTFVGCIIFVAATALFSLFIGSVFFDGVGAHGKNYVGSFLTILLCLAAYFSLFFAISVSLRKTGGAIAISILGPIIVGLIFSLISAIIDKKGLDLSDYWLPNRVAILQAADVAGKEIWIGCVIAAVVIAASSAVGYILHKKREA